MLHDIDLRSFGIVPNDQSLVETKPWAKLELNHD